MTAGNETPDQPAAAALDATAVERAKIYRELHRDHLDSLNATRHIEWIVNGALWAGVVLVAGQVAGHVDLSWLRWRQIVWAGFGAGVLHYLLWMYPIQSSENADGEMAREHLQLTHLALRGRDLGSRAERAAAIGEIGNSLPTRTNTSIYRRFGSWFLRGWLSGYEWALIECGTTAMLVCGVLAFLKKTPWVLK